MYLYLFFCVYFICIENQFLIVPSNIKHIKNALIELHWHKIAIQIILFININLHVSYTFEFSFFLYFISLPILLIYNSISCLFKCTIAAINVKECTALNFTHYTLYLIFKHIF